MSLSKKDVLRIKRHRRILLRLHGTSERPRLTVRRSLNNMSVQAIDDISNKTIFSLSTLDKEIRQATPKTGNVKAANLLGETFAKRAITKGIKQVIFDRSGYLYHGRIKALAEGLRKGGLEF